VDSKIVLIQAMKACTESGDSPTILRSRSRWRWVVSLMLWPFYLPPPNPRKERWYLLNGRVWMF